MNRSALLALLASALTMPAAAAPAEEKPEPRVFDIRDHGAVADGKTKVTDAIAEAVRAASKAGGGVVRVPKGTYLTGAVELLSGVTLQVDEGATLRFSADPDDYPKVRTRWEGTECINYSGLVHARGAKDIAITGKGTLDGQGRAWWKRMRTQGKARKLLRAWGNAAEKPDKLLTFASGEQMLRPSMIQPISCKGVLIEGVTLKQSPMWTVHPIYCEDVIVRGATILGDGPNTDGVNPDSCRNVLIEKCRISTGDDCVAIKSGRDADGRRVGRPCENIVVQNCTMERGHGGVVIGSEMSGGVKNVVVMDCTFKGTDRGIRLKTQRGRGGVVENVGFSRITMKGVGTAIVIDMLYSGSRKVQKPGPGTPTFRDIRVSDVKATGCRRAASIVGLEESPVKGLMLSDVSIAAKTGFKAVLVRDAKFHNVKVTVEKKPAWHLTDVKGKGLPDEKQP